MRSLNLALQGGGSHGAFTWGVLDALLADGRIGMDGLSGTSAGAVNAVALASGWATALAAGTDPRQGAREALSRLWGRISGWGTLGTWHRQLSGLMWGGLPPEFAPANIVANTFRGLFSPYQANPLDINPLRKLLEEEVDFEALQRHGAPKVFVSATHVRTGKAVIFTGRALTADAVMASACLPMLFQAVEIDGEHYWDGGYSVNPPLTPLIQACDSEDLMLVQINPLQRDSTPQSTTDILDRVNEMTFNASLLTQMRSIDFVNRLLEEGALKGSGCKVVLMHRIDGGSAMQRFPVSSRTQADAIVIQKLFEIGQQSAREWLERHFDALGKRSTVDIRRDYLDDTRIGLPPSPSHSPTGFRPWLAQLLKRHRNGGNGAGG
jgi:NTE family protein